MENDSRILITIDTEVGESAKFVSDGFEKFILGKIGDQYFGIPKIIEILDMFNYKAEFFVDVYECKFFGEENYKKLCNYIIEHGHAVQLHTHPSYAYDITRVNMYDYSLDEQIAIISDGKELIKKWTGKYPIAHRTGMYGANDNTLKAVNNNEIIFDSSYFYKHPNCKINLSIKNKSAMYCGITEIPITVIDKKYKRLGIIPVRKWPKLDINWLNETDLINGINNCKNKCYLIMLFLHSFSFITDNTDHTVIKKDLETINKFENILKTLNEDNMKSILFEDLIKKNIDFFNFDFAGRI